jgi:hypothetical protein
MRKLALEDLAVESFGVSAAGDVRLASDSYNGCETGADPCFSKTQLCSLPCIEPSNRTNVAYCCG